VGISAGLLVLFRPVNQSLHDGMHSAVPVATAHAQVPFCAQLQVRYCNVLARRYGRA
jgi:hypothetical protein